MDNNQNGTMVQANTPKFNDLIKAVLGSLHLLHLGFVFFGFPSKTVNWAKHNHETWGRGVSP